VATPLDGFVTAVAEALVAGQNGLDDAGRASLDRFDDTGVPPTVLAWNRLRFAVPIGARVRPGAGAGEQSRVTMGRNGAGRLSIAVRYFESPQGTDDPRPEVPPAGGDS
jgi:hypothetical protein